MCGTAESRKFKVDKEMIAYVQNNRIGKLEELELEEPGHLDGRRAKAGGCRVRFEKIQRFESKTVLRVSKI